MSKEAIQSLYDTITKDNYNVGTIDYFTDSIQDSSKRRSLYNTLVGDNYKLPEYEIFESKISTLAPEVKLDSVITDPDSSISSFNNIIYESVKRQENSVATNNPYGVNMPRKKSNADKILGLGGKLMAGSNTLLEFNDLESGEKAGKEIIDNILKISKNDPATFYSNYSGLPIESPEVKSFTEIVNTRSKNVEKPEQVSAIPGLLEALEYNKTNPRYVMSALKDPDPKNKIKNLQRNISKFVMGTPTSSIEGIEAPLVEYEPTAKDLAIFERDRQFKQQIAKEKKENGLSDLDAYLKVKSKYQDGMPSSEVLANMWDSSQTGSLFRIFGVELPMMKNEKELKLYREILEKDPNYISHSKFEQLAAGALSLVMPVDQYLFAVGGGLSKLKSIGKFADFIANKISKVGKVPLPQTRVYAKNALERITGGAGGFAAFDGGRSIVSQVRETGSIDPLQVVEETMKGFIVGSFTSGLGLAGNVAGKKYAGKTGEKSLGFAGEILGLGSVAPILQGEDITAEGYFDAAGTIIGLKLIKALSPSQAKSMKKVVANEIAKGVANGKTPLEAGEAIQNRLKTAVELAIENKPRTTVSENSPIEYKLSPLNEPYSSHVRKLVEAQKKAGVVEPLNEGNKLDFERNQIESEINKLSKDMDVLEKGGARQEILDDIQIEIDSRVQRKNIIMDAYGFAKVPTVLSESVMGVKESPSPKDVNLQIRRRSISEQNRLDNYLKDKDALNTTFKSDPMMEVPLHPADAGRQAVRIIEVDGAKQSISESYNKINKGGTQLELVLEKAKLQSEPVKANSLVEVPINPVKESSSVASPVKPPKKLISELPENKKLKGFLLQKEYNDLNLTIKSNEQALKSERLTPKQKERLESSNQKAKELRRDTVERAESDGIEMQQFSPFGIFDSRVIKKIFGSSKGKPKRYSEAELDRLYGNAMDRLSKKDKESSTVIVSDKPSESTPVYKGRRFGSPTYHFVFSNVVDRARAVGTKTSIEGADMGKEVINVTKKVRGDMALVTEKGLQLTGAKFGETGKAVSELQNFIEVEIGGNKILQSKLHAAIEGLEKVSGKEAEVVEAVKDVIERRGKVFEDYNIYTEGKDGVPRPFKVMGREIAPRVMTPEFYRIMEKGAGTKEFNELIIETAKATGATEASVKEYYSEFKDNFSGDISSSPTRTTQVEHSRKWKNIPHALIINGEAIPLVEYRPFEYIRALQETGAARVGVASVFGQELAGTSKIQEIKQQISKEGGTTKEFHEMIRSLSGAPLEAPLLSSGVIQNKIYRAADTMLGLVKATQLSMSSIVNIPEPLGSIREFGGMGNLVKSIKDMGFGSNKIESKVLERHLLELGAITSDVTNLAFDPIRPVQSRIKAIREGIGKGFLYRGMNQAQEFLAGQTAVNKIEQYKKRKNNPVGSKKSFREEGDVVYLQVLGFSKSEAELMASGKAPESLYNELIRRAPSALTSGAQLPGEQSRLEQNRIFKGAFAFESYAQMKLRSLSKQLEVGWKVGNEAINEKNPRKLLASMELPLSNFGGGAAAGMAAQFALAFVYGGKDNVGIKWNEADENWLKFAVKSWGYSNFAGFAGKLIQSTSGGDEFITDAIYPLAVAKELFKAGTSTGRYTYDDKLEKSLKLFNRFFPANRALTHATLAFGLGNPEAFQTNNAIKAYYRWKISNSYGGTYTSKPDKEIIKFRGNMRKAYESLKNQNLDKFDGSVVFNHLKDAVTEGNKDPSSVRRSLLGKRLFLKSKIAPGKSEEIYKARKEELRKRIGDKAFNRLIAHDELIELFNKELNAFK